MLFTLLTVCPANICKAKTSANTFADAFNSPHRQLEISIVGRNPWRFALHACKLSSFGHCHAIFTERLNGIANQHCIATPVHIHNLWSRDEQVKTCFDTRCGTVESPWFHEVKDKLQPLVLVRGCCSARCFCCFGGCGCGNGSDYARVHNCGFGLCYDHETCKMNQRFSCQLTDFSSWFNWFTKCCPVFHRPGAPSPMLVAMLAVSRSRRWFT